RARIRAFLGADQSRQARLVALDRIRFGDESRDALVESVAQPRLLALRRLQALEAVDGRLAALADGLARFGNLGPRRVLVLADDPELVEDVAVAADDVVEQRLAAAGFREVLGAHEVDDAVARGAHVDGDGSVGERLA